MASRCCWPVWVESVVFGITARDAGTYALAAVVLTAVGLAAAWLPAWRVARMNPTDALRSA